MGAIASVANAEKSDSTYINPVWHLPVADPAVLRADDGFFYVYATQGIGPDSVMCNIQILRSADLVHWTHIGDALPEKPQWASSSPGRLQTWGNLCYQVTDSIILILWSSPIL